VLKKLLLFVVLSLVLLVAVVGWAYKDSISRIPVEEKVIALTYDDGPNPPHTTELLKVLGSRGVKASFFPKARNVEAFPDDLLAVARAGHEIGNHSYYHRPMVDLGRQAMFDEVERANAILTDLLGYRPVLFRPPYGIQGLGLWRSLRSLKMPSILMSASGLDWELTDARQIADHVLADVEPGDIILLHDGHGDVDEPGSQDSRAATVEATALLIDELRAQGYRFVTVSELMAMADGDV